MLPSSSSVSLVLAHPSSDEIYKTHELSSKEWAGALIKEQYIENEHQLASLLDITHWILTEGDVPPGERPIFASCETIRKRCFISDEDIGVRGAFVEAVAAVFCEPEMRGRGYGGRMMKELGTLLRDRKMDKDGREAVGSILFSDIGPTYYANLGWAPFASAHLEMPASPASPDSTAIDIKPVLAKDISDLCAQDQAALLDSVGGSSGSKTLLVIVPDHSTMLWHHAKEDYICQKLFGRKPSVKGAVAGEPGDRVWVIWTRGLYGPLDEPDSGNKLYILRLVMENPNSEDLEKQTEQLKAVLDAARYEAAMWRLSHVEMWNPDEITKALIQRMGLPNRLVERQNEGIPSLMWFSKSSGGVEWIASEKYAWC